MKKNAVTNLLTITLMVTAAYLLLKYQDSESFQGFMNFLFNPDSRFALTPFWQQHRLLILVGVVAMLLIYYQSTFANYSRFAQLYAETRPNSGKPSITPLKAAYIYRQDRNVLAVWLLEMCRRNALILHYQKALYPWSISRGPGIAEERIDRELVDEMFTHDRLVTIKALLGEPNPPLKNAHLRLIRHLKQKNDDLFHKNAGPLPLFLLFTVSLVEIPFHMAGLQDKASPLTLIIALFSAGAIALPVYAVSREFMSFFTGPKIKASLLVCGTALISAAALIMLLGAPRVKIAAIFFPALMLSMAVIIYNAPHLLKNRAIREQIWGYRKYLENSVRELEEQDLSWTIGLEVHADIGSSLTYADRELPKWLVTEVKDSKTVIHRLHNTFGQYVSEALYGKMRSRGKISRGLARNRS